MDDITTDPSACASPDGAPPSLTPAAGAQTDRPVVLAVEWPGTERGGDTVATIAIRDMIVTVGVAWDSESTCPYVWRHDGATTAEEDDAIEDAIATAWDDREDEDDGAEVSARDRQRARMDRAIWGRS